jgi:hypothetical protein
LRVSGNGDISFYEDTGTTPKFFWDASAEKLELSNLKLYSDNVRNEGGILYIGTSGNNATQFYNNDANTLHISGAGNVGIGTSSPYGALTVDTANGILNIANGNTSGGTKIQAWGATPSNGYLAIEGYDKEYARFDASGNVGIGTQTPQAAKFSGSAVGILELANTKPVINIHETDVTDAELFMGMSGGSAVIGTTGNGKLIFQTGTSSASISAIIDASGNLLVGTTSAFTNGSSNSGGSGALHIARDNERCLFLKRASSNGSVVEFFRGSISSAVGSISITASATAFNTSSDARLKDNIVDSPSASDDIDAIQVRSFDWKVDGSHQKYGMVAQELQGVAPEAVSAPEDPDEMMGVDYSKLVPMMLKEIQSLRARVQQLENN